MSPTPSDVAGNGSAAPNGVPTASGLSVGDPMPEWRHTLTTEEIAAYAEASGDRNPIHLDEAFARSVGLGGIIGHGMLSMGLMATALGAWLGDPGRVRALFVRFAAVVRPGDTMTFTGKVTTIAPQTDTALVTLSLSGVNQRGEKVLNRGQAAVELPL